MQRNSQFTLTLPSNASSKLYPDNKPQSYKIALPAPIELEGKWKVALMEMQYPNNWFNITEYTFFEIIFKIKTLTGSKLTTPEERMDQFLGNRPTPDGPIDEKIITLPISVEKGYYQSIEQLCEIINSNISNALKYEDTSMAPVINRERPVTFSVNPTTNKLTINSSYGRTFINPLIGSKLWLILGFPDWFNNDQRRLPASGSKPAAIALHHPSIFVYCDIIEHQVVGDVYAPLLRVVPIKGMKGDYVWQTFERPIYLDVKGGYINTIELKLCDDSGNPIQFEAGKVLVVLDFKRVG